jgi:hypothetical protein
MAIVTDVPLSDPLSEVTRRERRLLLAVSVIGLFVSYSGIVPTKVDALGIELSSTDQRSFLTLLALVIVYLLIAFVIYGFADFLTWRKEYQKLMEQGAKEFLRWDPGRSTRARRTTRAHSTRGLDIHVGQTCCVYPCRIWNSAFQLP